MNYIRAYSIRIYEKEISHNYYCQIVTHEICDVDKLFFLLDVFCDMLHIDKDIEYPKHFYQHELREAWF